MCRKTRSRDVARAGTPPWTTTNVLRKRGIATIPILPNAYTMFPCFPLSVLPTSFSALAQECRIRNDFRFACARARQMARLACVRAMNSEHQCCDMNQLSCYLKLLRSKAVPRIVRSHTRVFVASRASSFLHHVRKRAPQIISLRFS